MAAWRASAQGAKVIAFEESTPAHRFSSSVGGSRIFRTINCEGPHYIRLAQYSAQVFRELESQSGQELLLTTGALIIGTAQDSFFSTYLASARESRLGYELLNPALLRSRFPQHMILSDDQGLLDTTGGVIRPEKTIAAAIAAARQHGAHFCLATAAHPLSGKDSPVTVLAGNQHYRAQSILLATGAWPTVSTLPITCERSTLEWFPAKPGTHFGPSNFPPFLRSSHGLSAWGIPDIDSLGVKIGRSGGREILDHPDENRRRVPMKDPTYSAYVRQALPGLSPQSTHQQSCFTARTPDGRFIIDQDGSVTYCLGLGGNGFKFAPALADAAVSLALSGYTSLPVAQFAADRFAPSERPQMSRGRN